MPSWEKTFFWSYWWLSPYRGHSSMKCWTASISTQSHLERLHWFNLYLYSFILQYPVRRCGKEIDPKEARQIRIPNQLDLVAWNYYDLKYAWLWNAPALLPFRYDLRLCCGLDILIGDNRDSHRLLWVWISDQISRYNCKCIRMIIGMSMQWKRVILRASWALKSERGVVYVDGGLNRTTWEAQWLEHQLISKSRGIKLLLGGIFP